MRFRPWRNWNQAATDLSTGHRFSNRNENSKIPLEGPKTTIFHIWFKLAGYFHDNASIFVTVNVIFGATDFGLDVLWFLKSHLSLLSTTRATKGKAIWSRGRWLCMKLLVSIGWFCCSQTPKIIISNLGPQIKFEDIELLLGQHGSVIHCDKLTSKDPATQVVQITYETTEQAQQ